MGKRVDAVIIIQSVIFVVEFKVGAKTYESADLDQAMDYALDMHNFHEGSHDVTLAPILVATKAPAIEFQINYIPEDRLLSPICCNENNLVDAINGVLKLQNEQTVNTQEWETSGYKPTPTIIEATLALYNGHAVADIS